MAPAATPITEQYASITLNRESLKTRTDHRDGVRDGKVLVQSTLIDRIQNINTDICEAGDEDAFFVADMGDIYRQHLRWKMNLKRVKPHYGKYDCWPKSIQGSC